jgi:alpha-amylase
MSNPWNGKAILQAFYWNCTNPAGDWYTYLAKLAPRLAAIGFDGIWTPPPCKPDKAGQNMGYDPLDYYDLGQKYQSGATPTSFGSQDSFLRMIAVAHANGLEVYPDIVLDHCGDGQPDPSSPFPQYNTNIHPVGFAGSTSGRWPRNWLDFHPNPVHWNGAGDWFTTGSDTFGGSDFCYQGRCSDSGNADQNCATRQNARDWFTWFVKQTGVDGFRFDDVKGYPPEVVADLLYNAMGDTNQYFCVGEYVPNQTSSEQDSWASQTNDRAGTFDYSLRDGLKALAESGGFYDVGSLPSQQQQNRTKTSPFVNNHDTCNPGGPLYGPVDPDNARAQLAYAFAIAIDGSPEFFFGDLFNINLQNAAPDASEIVTRPWVENLLWCHQKLAIKGGDYFVRYQGSQQLLIIERGARAIIAINNDGDSWHDAWISTAFFPNTQLHDYSGSRADDIWVNQEGWVNISVPPCSYSVWGPAGVSGGFMPAVKRTLQTFEMDDDLGDSNPQSSQYGGRAIPQAFRTAGAIWPAADSQVNLSLTADSSQQIDLQVVAHGAAPILQISGGCGQQPLLASFTPPTEAYYTLQVRLAGAGCPATRIYVTADYVGPATSTVF